jgi:triosephosphate isomerase (TIM)
MRRIIVAGNWKMNKTFQENVSFCCKLAGFASENKIDPVTSIICPPSPYLHTCREIFTRNNLYVGAQEISAHEFGAYTGEVSAPMLNSIGVEFCLVGHSERRQYHQETDSNINHKTKLLLSHGITPIVCIGEKEDERGQDKTEQVITSQLMTIFADIELTPKIDIVIAYEPVWAIGTGKTATPEMAQEVHGLIREWLTERYDKKTADSISVLYGGSIKPDNFASLLAQKDIDGGLIGGASLEIESYLELLKTGIKAAQESL